MKCPSCGTALMKPTREGRQMVHTRGLLMKGGELVFVCPNTRCKADVPAGPEVRKALVLFLSPAPPAVGGKQVVTKA